jgi:hypothetical protein
MAVMRKPDIQRRVEHTGHLRGHGYAAARQRKHQQVVAPPQADKGDRKPASGVCSIAKGHGAAKWSPQNNTDSRRCRMGGSYSQSARAVRTSSISFEIA